MININRLRIVVKTNSGQFEFDQLFDKKVNFIASSDNTQGKSSCIEGIYYCLGLEELIGGKNEHALKPVFRSKLEYGNEKFLVLESEFYMQISNHNHEIITINRVGKKEGISPSLVQIYFSKMDSIYDAKTKVEPMYVHQPGSATNIKGFHNFLENFLGFKLPKVRCFDEQERKLYLQLIFSAFFIEQKRGWADFFANIPTYLKVKESRKRVVEFVLGLESLENEKLKEKYREEEKRIKREWKRIYDEVAFELKHIGYSLKGISDIPSVLDEEYINQINIIRSLDNGEIIELDEDINSKIKQLNEIEWQIENNERDDIEELHIQLNSIKDKTARIESSIAAKKAQLVLEQANCVTTEQNISILEKDITNNQDALKLKKLGASINLSFAEDLCPICHQKIQDSLLQELQECNFMSIEENIRHLKAQKNMLLWTLKAQKQQMKDITLEVNEQEKKLLSYNKIAKSILDDIYTVDCSISEAKIAERVELINNVEDLKKTREIIKAKVKDYKVLSNDWKDNLANQEKLPSDRYTQMDKEKINMLKVMYVNYLKKFRYSSDTNFDAIQISDDKLMPTIEDFDMKFDSSASDNVRAIWAFTLALLQSSCASNHSRVLIFDEPRQHSIVVEDMKKFFETLVNLEKECQIIVGITLKDAEMIQTINNMNKDKYKVIYSHTKFICPVEG